MARRALPADLKKAISMLPDREKDKLLFRLIAKEPILTEQLRYKFLEDSSTQLERRETLLEDIQLDLDKAAAHFYSPGYLLLLIRSLSGDITRHMKVTKDKYGEIELNFFMLNYSLDKMGDKIALSTPRKSKTFDTYVVRRAAKLLTLIDKLHDDYQLDFASSRQQLSRYIQSLPNMYRIAQIQNLDLEGLSA